jgi:PadR family transcriptional regulator AphA
LQGEKEIRLTATSYIVLGLLELVGEATPYGLKRLAADSVGHFWTLHHAQLYSETERLAGAGYLKERRETTGRRRKRYSLTRKGHEALERWRAQPTGELAELRIPGILQLFFATDPAELAPVQLESYRRELAQLEAIQERDTGAGPRGPWLALEAGIRITREAVSFWEDVLAHSKPAPVRARRRRSSRA